MNLRLRINGKMLLFILGITILVYVSALAYAAFQLRLNSYKNAHYVLEAKTIDLSNDVQAKLNSYIEPVMVLAQMFSNHRDLPKESKNDLFEEMLYKLLEKNHNYSALATIWEPGVIDTALSDTLNTSEKYQCTYIKQNDELSKLANVNLNEEIYQQVKSSGKPLMIDPFEIKYENADDDLLISRVITPINIDDTFLGIVIADIPMLYIQQHYSKMHPMGDGSVFVISSKDEFLAHPSTEYYGKNIDEYSNELNTEFGLSTMINEGVMGQFNMIEPLSGDKSIFDVTPIFIDNIDSNWAFMLSVPLATIYEQANRTFRFVIMIGLIGLVLISLVIWGIARSITNPIVKTTRILEELSRGNIRNVKKMRFVFNDEINDMAQGMNQLVEGLNSAAMFAQQIGEGYLDVDYKLLGEKDALGTSLIAMQSSLKKAKEAEDFKRVEDEKRNWVTHGLAKFGEVIRQHNDNMERFTLNVTQNIVDYVGVAQVAMYVNQQIEDEYSEQDIFELKALIAYNKVVKLEKSFKDGEELLGRATLENRTIYMEDLPVRYVLLSPGMQDEKRPTNLLITPISINDVVLGTIEILSYDKFEAHQIDFIEKLSENIASVVSSVKTNIRTEKLLSQSQNQADELAQHEEEMRQNLEEMEATQEEANKRQEELRSYLKAVKGSILTAELDLKGRIVDISPAMSVVYGASIENMRGKFYDAFVAQDKQSQDEYSEFWQNLIKSGAGKRMQKFKHRNKETVLLESYKIVEKEGLMPKVIVAVIDKSLEKELNDELEKEMKKLS